MTKEDILEPTLEDHGIFMLTDEITTTNTSSAIEFILKQNFKTKKGRINHLTLIINSMGGDLNSAFALIDVMRGSKIPIHTVGLGQISSAGLLIFMTGAKGNRTITPNTSILSHQYSTGSYGKEHELLAIIKEFKLAGERLTSHYMKCTGMKEKEVREILMPASDIYLDAKEAIKYNIADRIAYLT